MSIYNPWPIIKETHNNKASKNRWFWQLLLWGFVSMLVVLILFGLFVGLPYARLLRVQNSVVHMAYDLVPPQYPGSVLINQQEGGGPTTAWDRRTYQTSDDLEAVLEFMESQELELGLSERADVSGPVYQGRKCNTSQTAIESTRLLVGGTYPWYSEDEGLPVPCVSVAVYASNDNPDAILIEVWLDWPAF